MRDKHKQKDTIMNHYKTVRTIVRTIFYTAITIATTTLLFHAMDIAIGLAPVPHF